jgi:hypothetical protein
MGDDTTTTRPPDVIAPASGVTDTTTNTGGLVRLASWWDPDLAFNGFVARSDYVERYWLPVLGPSALLALRWSAEMLSSHPDGVSVRLSELARGLGLGTRGGSAGPAARALERLAYFGLARERSGTLMVRTHVPPLPPVLLRRLPQALRDSHGSWLLRTTEPEGRSAPAPRASRLPPNRS